MAKQEKTDVVIKIGTAQLVWGIISIIVVVVIGVVVLYVTLNNGISSIDKNVAVMNNELGHIKEDNDKSIKKLDSLSKRVESLNNSVEVMRMVMKIQPSIRDTMQLRVLVRLKVSLIL